MFSWLYWLLELLMANDTSIIIIIIIIECN